MTEIQAVEVLKWMIKTIEFVDGRTNTDILHESVNMAKNALLSNHFGYEKCDGCYYQTHGSFGKCFSCIREKTDNYTLNGPKIKED